MDSPVVSVIVPVYNVKKYLPECIDSILAQTFRDFELILVDDGSTDNCSTICNEYAATDSRIQVIHQKNSGVSAARNSGLDIAAGQYISFVDSDDVIDIRYLELLYDTLLKSNADIASCRFERFYDTERPTPSELDHSDPIEISGKEACLSLYTGDGRTHVTLWGKLYSTHLFHNIRFPEGKLHEDDAVTPKLFYYANKVAVGHNCLYFYRTRPGSIMTSAFSVKRFDCLEAIDNCISFFQEKGETEILDVARTFREKSRSLYILQAYDAGMKTSIPQKYRCSQTRAIIHLMKILPSEKFDWYVQPFHPKLVHFISYVRKTISILSIK